MTDTKAPREQRAQAYSATLRLATACDTSKPESIADAGERLKAVVSFARTQGFELRGDAETTIARLPSREVGRVPAAQ